MRRCPKPQRAAFTLVELMMVVAIIGILAGLIVPAVFAAMRAVKSGAMAMEAQTLAQAVEAYKNKYNDYPPDGSSAVVFERHFRKLFPQILDSEFTVVRTASGLSSGAYMDCSEALVFVLGGYSTDKTKPFTGPGGPLEGGTGYNTTRDNPLFEFNTAQLSINDDPNSNNLPSFRPRGLKTPYAYFDSRTYTIKTGNGLSHTSYGSGTMGYARPYRSDSFNKKISPISSNPDAYYAFVNDRSFQIIGAGLDDNFGNVAGKRHYLYPSGESVDFDNMNSGVPTVGAFTRYLDSAGDALKYQHDNVTNFAEGKLADSLPN